MQEQRKTPYLRPGIISDLFWGALLTIGTLEKSRRQETGNRIQESGARSQKDKAENRFCFVMPQPR
jgi:hypothetical protein